MALKGLKIFVRRTLIALRDAFGPWRFARRGDSAVSPQFSVTQPFTASETLEKKKYNLRQASGRIARYRVAPGEVFSFWRAVGNPNTRQWQASRSIVAGRLQIERGGGLCQASGIIYHLSLMAGLKVLERHSHSADLYTEQTRFCPLGSDATVAYGYKDLRLLNTTQGTIAFELRVEQDQFVATLLSDKPVERHEIEFRRKDLDDGRLSAVAVDTTTGQVLAESTYLRI